MIDEDQQEQLRAEAHEAGAAAQKAAFEAAAADVRVVAGREAYRQAHAKVMARGIVDVHAGWDDRDQTFRVYLMREGDDEGQPLQAAITDGSLDARLYRAAFAANARDFTGAHERVVGFEKEAAAKRCAKAVKAELKAIANGKPPVSDHTLSMAAQIAQILKKGKRR